MRLRHLRSHRVASSLVFCAGFGACMVGPDYAEPEARVNDAWLYARDPRVETTPANYGAWWRSFDDPVLDQLVAAATEQNLTLQIAGLRVLGAMAQRGIAVGEFFPQTQFAAGAFSRSLLSENTSTGRPPTRYVNSYDGGLTVAWELDFWGRFRREIESADASLEASIADYDTVMVALIAEVASTYVEIRTLEEQLDAAAKNIEYQRESLRLTQAKFDAGATSELDVALSRSILRETEASVPNLETQHAQARNQLGFLLGQPPSELAELLGEPSVVPRPPAEVAVGIPADLLRRRPDVRSAERTTAAQCAQIGVAEADFYPAISIAGSIGFVAEKSSDFFDANSAAGVIEPSFSWPLLNYGRIENNVRVQEAAFQEEIVNYRNTVLQAAAEVEDGLVAFLNAQEEVRLLSDAVAAAEQAVQLATIRYRDGSSSYAPVLLALRFLVGAMDLHAVARGSVGQGLIATYKALGGGWEVRAGGSLLAPEVEAELRARNDWGDMLSPDYAEGSDLGFPRPDPK